MFEILLIFIRVYMSVRNILATACRGFTATIKSIGIWVGHKVTQICQYFGSCAKARNIANTRFAGGTIPEAPTIPSIENRVATLGNTPTPTSTSTAVPHSPASAATVSTTSVAVVSITAAASATVAAAVLSSEHKQASAATPPVDRSGELPMQTRGSPSAEAMAAAPAAAVAVAAAIADPNRTRWDRDPRDARSVAVLLMDAHSGEVKSRSERVVTGPLGFMNSEAREALVIPYPVAEFPPIRSEKTLFFGNHIHLIVDEQDTIARCIARGILLAKTTELGKWPLYLPEMRILAKGKEVAWNETVATYPDATTFFLHGIRVDFKALKECFSQEEWEAIKVLFTSMNHLLLRLGTASNEPLPRDKIRGLLEVAEKYEKRFNFNFTQLKMIFSTRVVEGSGSYTVDDIGGIDHTSNVIQLALDERERILKEMHDAWPKINDVFPKAIKGIILAYSMPPLKFSQLMRATHVSIGHLILQHENLSAEDLEKHDIRFVPNDAPAAAPVGTLPLRIHRYVPRFPNFDLEPWVPLAPLLSSIEMETLKQLRRQLNQLYLNFLHSDLCGLDSLDNVKILNKEDVKKLFDKHNSVRKKIRDLLYEMEQFHKLMQSFSEKVKLLLPAHR